ncbi:MAG TPA: cytochrome b N-terminal domain-containing protein [Burkholderiaceae bacterium]|nr:cytochrome b N-terminal domain-containing protein [Burkholderiaceae bacterium]
MIGLSQRALRAAFLRAEARLNAVLGDALNPLYHLGAITFFLFWVVGASGLYLYAFFDTSVEGAYGSVQALTHGQWYAGGVLRSVHRYASDAMVVTMAIHLVRHFAFDRLRGFRAFSWITGVVLIALVGLAGANGYMLPWDRLAQWVTQASFEWLDALPGFGGTLIRNFIVPEAVSNRLFSLLVFIHIGVPLATLLLMWVHVQRVPKAKTTPPRPIAVALLAMLALMAALQPVASQGGAADLRLAPTALALDWLLLGLFPLADLLPPRAAWAALGGAALLLALLPWLPLRRRTTAAVALTVHPGPVHLQARPGETLLEAGLRAGLALPYDCRAGGCGQCVCTVLHGRVDPGACQPGALGAAMRARGQVLMCTAVPLEAVEVEVEGVASLAAGTSAPRRWVARVARLERLSDDLMRIELALPSGQRIEYAAGQYLNVVLGDGARRAFSFASAPRPGGNEVIELHVRWIPGGRFTTQVFTALREGDALEFEGPLGRFVLSAGERPILFVAGATGFAPIKSIVEDAFARGVQRPMQLYWGVRHARDLYLVDIVERWQREHANFAFVPVLSEPEAGWAGRRGLVHEAMLADHPDLAGYEVYACGSVRMVQAAVPDFLAHGLGEQFCFSDAFTPAPAAGASGAGPSATPA